MNIDELQKRIEAIEQQLNGVNFVDSVRNAAFVDVDSSSTRLQTIATYGGGTADVPLVPDTYIRIYFRGKILNIPAYNLV